MGMRVAVTTNEASLAACQARNAKGPPAPATEAIAWVSPRGVEGSL
jgi:hypothetical protein